MKIAKVFCAALAFIIIAFTQANASDNIPSYSQELIAKTKVKIESEPDYAAKYFSSALKLRRAENETYFALQNVNNEISSVENKMRVLMSAAGKLPDGTLVFQSNINPQNYYAIDGRAIPEEQAKNLGKNIAPWEDYYALYQARKDHQSGKAEIEKYKTETLEKSRSKLIDPDLLGLAEPHQNQWNKLKQTNN